MKASPPDHALARPTALGCIWMAVLLGALAWLNLQRGEIFLVPPFAATTSVLLFLPEVPIARPFAVVVGSTFGTAIGTVLSLLLGFGPAVAVLAALLAVIALPLLCAFHPPGVALAMYAPLLHPTLWFSIQVVLPFTLLLVISAAAISRLRMRVLGTRSRSCARLFAKAWRKQINASTQPLAGGSGRRACAPGDR